MIVSVLIAVFASVIIYNAEVSDSSSGIIHHGQCGENASYDIYFDGSMVITGSGEMYSYNSTPAPWHEYSDKITKLTIRDGITKLGLSAFKDFENVTELTIPITLDSVVSDIYPAFEGCSSIKKINFTGGDNGYGFSYALKEDINCWYQHTPWHQSRDVLKEINFADEVKGIGSNAFRELQITSLVLPDSVVALGDSCFVDCSEITDLTIPVSLNPYGNYRCPAFKGCSIIQNITITNGNGIPFDYWDLKADWWTSYHSDLTPWNMNCEIPKTIIISDDVTDLGKYMFHYCNIREITVPISLDLTECKAFDGYNQYYGLKKVTVTKGTGAAVDYSIHAGEGYSDPYCTLSPWNNAPNLETVIVAEGVTHLGDCTFCCKMENLILPNSLTSLGDYVFAGSFIKNLTIPISLNATWLDDKPAFHDVYYIETVNFTPGSGYGFDYAAYKGSNCWYQHTPWYQSRSTLKEINFSEGITHIGSDAFRELNITSLVIPNSVDTLGPHAFYNLTNLTLLSIPATLNSVGFYKYPAFEGCANIKKMKFTGSGDWFEYDLFDTQSSYFRYTPWQFSKSALNSVEILYGVSSVGSFAFKGCTALKFIDISKSVTILGDKAFDGQFYDYDGVKELKQTVNNLAGFKFEYDNSKWIKWGDSSSVDPNIDYGRHGNTSSAFNYLTGTLKITGSGNMDSYSRGMSPWYVNKDLVTTLILDDDVSLISDYAFADFTNLVTVKLGHNLTYIEDFAFENCTSLKSITIPDSVKTIGDCAFNNCTSLATVNLGMSVSTIGECAFNGCRLTGSFTIPDSVTSIGDCAFGGCTSIITVNIGKSLCSFNKAAFNGCSSIASFVVSDENSTFSSVDGVIFSKDKTTLVQYPVAKTNASYDIPDIVSTIASSAFNGCTSLTTISIPESVLYIEKGAFDCKFYSANGEKELEPTFENLAGYTFNKVDGKWIKDSSSSINHIRYTGYCGQSFRYVFDYTDGILAIRGSGAMPDYPYDVWPWHPYKNYISTILIGDSITKIGAYAFSDCPQLTSIIVPTSVTTIGDYAFKGCTSLNSAIIPDSVTTIGDYAFEGCTSLESITSLGSVTTIGSNAFAGCTSLKSITSLGSVTIIGSNAFAGCASLSSAIVLNNVSSIDSSAFSGCTSLTSISFNVTLSNVGSSLVDGNFYDLNGETVLEQTAANLAGSSFKNIDGKWVKYGSAFNLCGKNFVYFVYDDITKTLKVHGTEGISDFSRYGAPWYSFRESIKHIIIEDSITAIGNNAFRGCTAIISVSIPDSVKTIGTSAFEGCTSLSAVHLGSSVNSIGGSAFKGCTSLASFDVSAENSIYSSADGVLFNKDKSTLIQYPVAKTDSSYVIPDSVTTIASSAFMDCTDLVTITIPVSVKLIGYGAFDAIFYESGSEIVLEQSAKNLAGATFKKVDGKWIKQKEFGICGKDANYELDLTTGNLRITGSGQMESYARGHTPWFSHKDIIKSIEISDTITSIGSFAFEGCTFLKSITISDSIETIGMSAFADCTSLATVNFGRSVASVEDSAFNGCSSLKSFVVSKDNQTFASINGVLFNKDLTALLKYPINRLESSYCIPTSVTVIASYAFKGCEFSISIPIPYTITYIGKNAFDVTFYDTDGETVLEMTADALAGCTFCMMDDKWVKQKVSGECGVNANYVLDLTTGTLIINGSGKIRSYSSESAPWYAHKDFVRSIIISDKIQSIGDFAFEDLSKIGYINIPNSVESIGESAFKGCSSLAKIDLDICLSSIGESAFKGCTALTSISIPNSVKSIGFFAFDAPFYDPDGKTLLEQTVENLVGSTFKKVDGKWIKMNEFGKCGESVSYELNYSSGTLLISGSGQMESYSNGQAPWFSHKDFIKSIVMTGSITSIGDFAFEGCTSLKSIAPPVSVSTIGVSAFEGCTSLATVNLSRSVSSIGDDAFKGCTSLSKFVVSAENLDYTSLNSVLFSKDLHTLFQYPGDKADTSYEIPAAVKIIKSSAFNGCHSLTTITIPASVTSIEDGAFDETLYDTDGETVLDQTFENLADSTFNKIDGKWIKLKSTPAEDPNKVSGECGDGVTYELVLSTGTLRISGSGQMGSYSSGQAPWSSHKDSIKFIVLNNSVTSIGASAFEGCTSLISVTLGMSVNSIGADAFKGCMGLATFTVSANNGTYTSLKGVLFSKDLKTLVQYPVAKAGISYAIPDFVTTINSSAFSGCTSLTSLTIPDSVTTIEDGAFDGIFYGTDGVKELEPTAAKLAGHTFNNVEGKWIKQKESGYCGKDVTYEFDESKGTLTIGGSGKMGSFSSGNAPWFSYKDSITSVTIADSVTSIGDFAFEGIASIKSITIPDSVTTIGASAFDGCTQLASIKLGNYVNVIEKSAFNGCSSLASFVVSDENSTYFSVDGVLFSKDKFTLIQYPVAKADISYEIPNAVTTIVSSAFKGCTSLTSITIPDTVKIIETGAFDIIFYDTDGENALDNEDLVGSIFNYVDGKWIKQAPAPSEDPNKISGECGEGVSFELDLSTGTLTINGSGKIGSYSSGQAPWSSHKDSIKFIEIAGSIKSLGDFAFEGITTINSITIPDTVELIGASAFADCTKLATVNFGKSVKSVSGYAFKGCTALASYVVSDENSTYSSVDGVLFNKEKTTLIQYPVAKTDSSYELPASVKIIASSAFNGCGSLTSLAFPDSIKTIEDGAFDMIFYNSDCEKVLEPTVENLVGCTYNKIDGKWTKQAPTPSEDPSEDLAKCGDNATFEFDSNSGTLTINGSGTMFDYADGTIPWDSFKGAIRSVVIGESVTSISSYAFSDCTSLTSVTIPDSVTSIGVSAFRNCTGLKELSLPASLDTVRSNDNPIFEGCVNIEKFTFTAGDGTWYSYDTGSSQSVSLRNNSRILNDNSIIKSSELPNYKYTPWQLSRSALTYVVISDGVTSIGDSAFKDCTAINSLSISNTVTTIGDSAFTDCTALTSIAIPDSVSSIGESAFKDCSSLTSVSLPDSVSSIGESVFNGCGSLTTLKLSENSSKYCSLNGVLYNKDMTELIWYPAGNTNTSFKVPDGVKSIGAHAFQENTHLTSITIPKSVISIADSAFSGKFYDTDGSELSQTTTGLSGSTFIMVDGKWIKQTSAPHPSLVTPSPKSDTDDETLALVFILVIVFVIILSLTNVVVRKRRI